MPQKRRKPSPKPAKLVFARGVPQETKAAATKDLAEFAANSKSKAENYARVTALHVRANEVFAELAGKLGAAAEMAELSKIQAELGHLSDKEDDLEMASLKGSQQETPDFSALGQSGIPQQSAAWTDGESED